MTCAHSQKVFMSDWSKASGNLGNAVPAIVRKCTNLITRARRRTTRRSRCVRSRIAEKGDSADVSPAGCRSWTNIFIEDELATNRWGTEQAPGGLHSAFHPQVTRVHSPDGHARQDIKYSCMDRGTGDASCENIPPRSCWWTKRTP